VTEGQLFSSISLYNGDRLIPIQAKTRGHELLITPLEGLLPSQSYTLEIPAEAIEDLAGNKWMDGAEISFRTQDKDGGGGQGPGGDSSHESGSDTGGNKSVYKRVGDHYVVTLSESTASIVLESDSESELGNASLVIQGEEIEVELTPEIRAALWKQMKQSGDYNSSLMIAIGPEYEGLSEQAAYGLKPVTYGTHGYFMRFYELRENDKKIALELGKEQVTIALKLDGSLAYNYVLVVNKQLGKSSIVEVEKFKGGSYVSLQLSETGLLIPFHMELPYTDLDKNHWAANAVKRLLLELVLQQKPIEEFEEIEAVFNVNGSKLHLEQKVTRAEFVGVLVRLLGLKTSTTVTSFEDIASEDQFAEVISVAREMGIIQGKGANQFDPNGLVTREQAGKVTVPNGFAVLSYCEEVKTVPKAPLYYGKAEGPWTLRRHVTLEWMDQAIEMAAVGARLSFRFVGRGLVLGFDFGKTSCECRYRLDFGEWITTKRDRPEWLGQEGGWFRVLGIADDLPPGEHHFEMEVIHGNRDGCSGTNCRLGMIGIII